MLLPFSLIKGEVMKVNVTAGQSLQVAINNAQPGDIIEVEAGVTFLGPVVLPAKSGTLFVTIQSSRVSELPQARISSSHASLMPKILCPAFEQAIKTSPGASFYKFDGIEVMPDPAVVSDVNMTRIYDLVRLGGGRLDQTTIESVPHHIKIDRCYIHGLSSTNFQRGISLNSMDTEITRSYISEIHAKGMDAQAICSWNTPGRLKIEDCYLEGSGENFLLGGSDPAIEAFIPADVQLLRCYLFKPLSWKGVWTVKNLLEIKAGKNIVIDGNVLENNWTDGQSGIPVLFTVRNQDGTAPYSIISNVVFSNNTVKNAEGAINLLGKDNEKPSQQSSGLLIRNNLFFDIRGPFLTMNGYHNVTVERNTHLQSSNTMTLSYTPSQGFIYRNNVTLEKAYGVIGDFGLIGTSGLEKWTPGYSFIGNVMAHPPLSSDQNWYGPMPPNNEYPPSLNLTADYRFDRPGIGADIDALNLAQATTGTSPLPDPDPTPTPTPAVQYEFKDELIPANDQIDALFARMGQAGYNQCFSVVQSKYFYFGRVKGTTAKYEWATKDWVNGLTARIQLANQLASEGYGNIFVWSGKVRASRKIG